MRYNWLILIVIGCNNSNELSNVALDNFQNDSINAEVYYLKNDNIETLEGIWIDVGYLEEIEKYKSVYLTDNKYTLLGFRMEKENLRSNSPFLFGFTSHESGYDIPICYDFSKNTYVLDTMKAANEFYKNIAIHRENNTVDTVKVKSHSYFKDYFELVVLNDDNLKLFFSKLKNEILYRKCNLNNELVRLLFEGTYVSIESGRKIAIGKDGQVIDFKDKTSYLYVVYDFGLNINYDAIFITDEKEIHGGYPEGDLYKFIFRNDTLELYYVLTDWDELEHIVDSVPTYFLIKE